MAKANGIFGSSDYFLGKNSKWKICEKSELVIIDPLKESMDISCGTSTSPFDFRGDLDEIFKGSGGKKRVLVSSVPSSGGTGAFTFQLSPQANTANANQGGYYIQNLAGQSNAGNGEQTFTITIQGNGGGQQSQSAQVNSDMMAQYQLMQAQAEQYKALAEYLALANAENSDTPGTSELSDQGKARELLNDPGFLEFVESQQEQGLLSFLGLHKRMGAKDIAKAARVHFGLQQIPENITNQFDKAAEDYVRANRDNVDDTTRSLFGDRCGDKKVSIADTRHARDREIILAANPELMETLNSPEMLAAMREVSDNGLDGKELVSLLGDQFSHIPENELEMVCNEFIDRIKHEHDNSFVEWNGAQIGGTALAGAGAAGLALGSLGLGLVNFWNPLGWGALAVGGGLFLCNLVFGQHGDGVAKTQDIDNYLKQRQVTEQET